MSNKEGRLAITDWAIEDRPREKLETLGPQALSNAELLAILIGSGSPGESAVELMKRILNDCNNSLNTLGKMSIGNLTEHYRGMGKAKAITILAACELGNRRADEMPEQRRILSSADEIYKLMLQKMRDLDVEEVWVLLMNQKLKLIKSEMISHGGLTEATVDVRVIMKKALENNATVMALCHNHPSGNPQPSQDDLAITRRVKEACSTLRIHFLDHVVVADGSYYSFRDEGRI